jgi:hypothetical protein
LGLTAKKHWILSGQALGVLFLQVKMTLSSEMPMRKEEKQANGYASEFVNKS